MRQEKNIPTHSKTGVPSMLINYIKVVGYSKKNTLGLVKPSNFFMPTWSKERGFPLYQACTCTLISNIHSLLQEKGTITNSPDHAIQ